MQAIDLQRGPNTTSKWGWGGEQTHEALKFNDRGPQISMGLRDLNLRDTVHVVILIQTPAVSPAAANDTLYFSSQLTS